MLRAIILAILCLTPVGCARRDGPPSDLPHGDSDTVRQPQPPAKETGKPEEANSAEKDGVRFTVQAPKTAVAGMGLPVQMKIINKGETTRFFHRETTDPTKLWIKATTKEGKT